MITRWPLLLSLAVLQSGCAQGPAIVPDKIISNNPCIDAILEKIADPSRIGGVSVWSHQADSTSASLKWARQFGAVAADAESIIAARPKLVLTGNLASSGTNDALKRASIPMATFGVPASISESIDQVKAVADVIDRREQGLRLASSLTDATQQSASTGKSAIIWQASGFVPGKETLQDEMLQRAGYRNASVQFGLGQWDQLPLETLMRSPPDIVFVSSSATGEDARALALRRRLLGKLGKSVRVVSFPDRLLLCGGPSMIDAMARFRNAGA